MTKHELGKFLTTKSTKDTKKRRTIATENTEKKKNYENGN